jgi:hypothetical protein
MENVSNTKAILILAAIFTLTYLVHISIQIVMFINESIYSEDMQEAIITITTIYSVPLAALIAPIFADKFVRKGGYPAVTFMVAIVLSLIWNLLLLSRSFIFLLSSSDSESGYLSFLDVTSKATAFLIVGAISYFTARKI